MKTFGLGTESSDFVESFDEDGTGSGGTGTEFQTIHKTEENQESRDAKIIRRLRAVDRFIITPVKRCCEVSESLFCTIPPAIGQQTKQNITAKPKSNHHSEVQTKWI
jgi:hypothetical protein